jgi:hypothetical protein
MSRQYADQVLVRCAPVPVPAVHVPFGAAPPEQFLWRNRIYRVRAVLQHWIEAGAWWRSPGGPAADEEYDLWRVEAAAGRSAPLGQYELCRDRSTDRWFLVRTFD